ncbi:MAG: hypothetical protein WC824_15550 [Bacteroidota bacterium]|jgi:hypothetical protein
MEYRVYCKQLVGKGFEICLHGASAGNNRRERQMEAVRLLNDEFCKQKTYICHSKNADNIYWEDKVTNLQPFKVLLKAYSRNRCSGEDNSSDYFWGDICYREIDYIRLHRTRRTDTLSLNPSMPYHNREKPYVKYWFSATKRAIKDCSDDDSLKRLVRNNGLTVLYQYLHRYSDPSTLELDGNFVRAIENIKRHGEIWVAPVGKVMDRLRAMQEIFLVLSKNEAWILNLNGMAVRDIQIRCPEDENNSIVVAEVPEKGMVAITKSRRYNYHGRNVIKLKGNLTAVKKTTAGMIYVNLSQQPASVGSACMVDPMSFKYVPYLKADHEPMRILSKLEESKLLLAQSWVILRELLLRKRSLNQDAFLGKEEIILESHDRW